MSIINDADPRRRSSIRPVDARSLRNMVETDAAARALRYEYFDPSVVNEPAWIVMQDLYLARFDDVVLRVKDICPTEGISKSTVQRYVDHLEGAGIVESRPDPSDTRSRLVQLTPTAAMMMEQFYTRQYHRQARTLKNSCRG